MFLSLIALHSHLAVAIVHHAHNLQTPTPLDVPATVEHPILEPILLSPQPLDEKLEQIGAYYAAKPWLVAARLAAVGAAAARVALAWTRSREEFDVATARLSRTRGQPPPVTKRGVKLRTEVSELGVVFIKLAQTLATRPDIIGEEAAAALEALQDQNTPFEDKLAKDIIAQDVSYGKLQLAEISERPLAAASLAQVYRARSAGGADVAIKVRRPGVVEQVALDSYAIRLGLRALQFYWGSNSTDYPGIVDEVTAGLFREIDFRLEAQTAPLFWAAHAEAAPYLRVPRPGLCSPSPNSIVTTRLHIAEWIDGKTLSSLPTLRRRDMIIKCLDVCFLQLFRTGFVHADLHTGNLLFDAENNLVLLDFGLCTRVSPRQTEAMAVAVAAIIARDWPGFLAALRDIGMIPANPFVWVDRVTGERADGLGPGVWRICDEDEFAASFVSALEADGRAALTFTDITERLTRLALSYQFILPTWLLFIIRAVLTLDGFADSMQVSVLGAAAPHAARRVLSPRTLAGEQYLRAALLHDYGEASNKLRFSPSHSQRPKLKLEVLSKLAQQTDPGRKANSASATYAAISSSTQATVLTNILRLLLHDTEGRALRRIACEVDARPLIKFASVRASRVALSVAYRSVHNDTLVLRRSSRQALPQPVKLTIQALFRAPFARRKQHKSRQSVNTSTVGSSSCPLGADEYLFAPFGVAHSNN